MEFANVTISSDDYSKVISVSIADQNVELLSSEFISGSVGYDAVQNIDSRIIGKTKDTNGNLYLSQNHSTDTFIRNTDVWCNDIDLTCISPSNSNRNNLKAGTLITPRHIINHSHYEYGVGKSIFCISRW